MPRIPLAEDPTTHDEQVAATIADLTEAFGPDDAAMLMSRQHPYLKQRTMEEAIRDGDYQHVRNLLGCVIYGNYI